MLLDELASEKDNFLKLLPGKPQAITISNP